MNFFKLADMDVSTLRKEVMDNYDDFYIDVQRQTQVIGGDTSYHAETLNYRLARGLPDGAHNVFNSDLIEKTEFYAKRPECVAFLNKFTKTYGGEVHRIIMVLLPAGKQVYPHPDGGSYYLGKDRFHIVLSGNYDMTLQDGDTEVTQTMSAGELWFFDNKKVHKSKNTGAEDRIAMIFDVKDSRWKEVCGV